MFIGLSRGKVFGGIIGFTLGYVIEEIIRGNIKISSGNFFQENEYEYTAYQQSLLALISEVVKADGYINKEEIYYIKDYLLAQFGSVYCNKMLKTLKLTVDKNYDVDAVTRKLRSLVDRTKRYSIVEFLYGITIQNGSVSKKEAVLLERIAKIIGLSKAEFDRIIKTKKSTENKSRVKAKQFGYNPYRVLGISEQATDAEVKKAYRKLVLKYHPDKTDEDDEIANEKFNEISEAYHLIKKRRNLK